jgi:hypothetical protein
MTGISLLTDETHHKRYLQLDLDVVTRITDKELHNYIDLVIAEVRDNYNRLTTEKKPKISSLRGKMTPMTNEQIDQQFNELRNEWERGI